MTPHDRRRAAGFTLLELLVAMSMTLVVSGAIYGLMTGGQNAFRREPELTERQQAIRIAMDMIVRDVETAGVGMPAFLQVFRPGLNACASAPTCDAPFSPLGESNQVADELEMITNNNLRGNEPLCPTSVGTPGIPPLPTGSVLLPRATANVAVNQPLLVTFADGSWTLREVTAVTPGDTTGVGLRCNGGTHTRLDFLGASDLSGMNDVPAPAAMCKPNGQNPPQGNCPINAAVDPDPLVQEAAFAEIVRWRIRNDATGIPELQRFSTATQIADLAAGTANPGWRTLVRGIEDLQVTYTQMNGNVSPPTTAAGAPPVVDGNYGSLITRVQVTLWSRATGPTNATAGLRTSLRPGGPAAHRGSLTATISPRAILPHIANQTTLASPAPSPAPLWQ